MRFGCRGVLLCGRTSDHGGWSFVVLQQINPPFFPPLSSELELGLKSVWLFVFIALTNLFI